MGEADIMPSAMSTRIVKLRPGQIWEPLIQCGQCLADEPSADRIEAGADWMIVSVNRGWVGDMVDLPAFCIRIERCADTKEAV